MAAAQRAFLRNRPYQAVAMTHFFIDALNSSRNLLVAIIAVAVGLTNTQVGVVLLLYNVGGSLSQPFFGWLAGRVGARWLAIGGLGWMIAFDFVSGRRHAFVPNQLADAYYEFGWEFSGE